MKAPVYRKHRCRRCGSKPVPATGRCAAGHKLRHEVGCGCASCRVVIR